jgi:outer membrane PBP1 activator LpoA protein
MGVATTYSTPAVSGVLSSADIPTSPGKFQENALSPAPKLPIRPLIAVAVLLLTTLLAGCATSPLGVGGGAQQGYRAQQQVAVLLPESGRYAGAAQAIRQAILAAQAASAQGAAPQLRFYDSSDPAAVPALLQRAVAEGATLAVGPLQKESVAALAAGTPLPIPTLALNRAPTDTAPANLYQFALSPEDEARDIADKAWARGLRSVLIVSPNSRWGGRVAIAFQQRWLEVGGQLAASAIYDPGAAGAVRAVDDLLARAASGTEADFLFLVANEGDAGSAWRRIQEAGYGRLPVYTPSTIYTGYFDPRAGAALVGLQFVDIPWLLAPQPGDPLSREQLRVRIPDMDARYLRLYAMGIDAYRLAPRLAALASRPGTAIEGATGRLSLDAKRRVQRELTLARMDPVGPVRLAMDLSVRPMPLLAMTGSDLAGARP